MNILVVDDSKANCRMMEKMFLSVLSERNRDHGCVVDTALCGESALDLVAKESYDINFAGA